MSDSASRVGGCGAGESNAGRQMGAEVGDGVAEVRGRSSGADNWKYESIYFKFTLIDSGIVQSVHGWSKGTYSWLWKRRTRTQLFIIFVFCIMYDNIFFYFFFL